MNNPAATPYTLYNLYKGCREQLNTRHDCTLSFRGETIQITALVCMLEDGDPSLEARFEAERAQPVTQLTSTKRASKYDRAEIARTAHRNAKSIGTGSYHQRLSTGFKMAWYAAKVAANGHTQAVYVTTLKPSCKPVTSVAPHMYRKPGRGNIYPQAT